MKKIIENDYFFDHQPPLEFIDKLRAPVHEKKPDTFNRKKARHGEVCADGIYINPKFTDDEGLLTTVFEDFKVFGEVYGIGGDKYPVTIVKGNTPCFEAYTVEVTDTECTITANDTEGVRRAVIYIEDEIKAHEGPFLTLGKVERKPWLEDRITRGFFSPTNRPPKNGDELFDDIEYYPDEYLNRLMHDGTNGLWIYSSFRQLLRSDIIKEYGEGSETRMAKLNRVIERCRRYGIKVYIFAIEPYHLTKELHEKYPEFSTQSLFGGGEQFPNCVHQELTKKYCKEATYKLFTEAPGLAGLIVITNGERATTCTSAYAANTCPICGKMPIGQALAAALEAMRAGIREANPKAKYISWTYAHRSWANEDIVDYVNHAPDDVTLMQNFDDRGSKKQLGRTRYAMDYWLSYIGPSEMFDVTARAAKKANKEMFAKMQICCSHEIATLPYVPAPENVFGKLKGAYKYGVKGIMECWYFGNYPCFMSKAVGELAFVHDFSDMEGFLKRLATITYGESAADTVSDSWASFSKGYQKTPINIMFSYYSPMHDGVVWELSLKPKNFPLSRSWLLMDKPDGDRIRECLVDGHTLDEAITLVSSMKRYYKRGLDTLTAYGVKNGELSDLYTVSAALYVLASSCLNIMKFYRLRDDLGYCIGDTLNILDKMKKLVKEEIKLSRRMIELCEADSRLGYHSEAEGFKFFPEKLRHRIKTLKELLATEFVEVEDRIKSGLAPLEYYLGVEEDCKHSYTITTGNPEKAEWEVFNEGLSKFRIADNGKELILDVRHSGKPREFIISPEFRLMHIDIPMGIVIDHETGEVTASTKNTVPVHWTEYSEKKAKWDVVPLKKEGDFFGFRVTFDKKKYGILENAPFKLRVSAEYREWEPVSTPIYTLGKHAIVPGTCGWVLYDKKD